MVFGTADDAQRGDSGGAVCVEGELISYAGPAGGVPRDLRDPVQTVEGWITPGLVDLHVHGAGGRDLMEGTPEALCLITDALPSAGLPDGVYAYDGRPYESRAGSAWHHADTGDQLFGTTLLMDEVVRRAVQFMGVTFAQAVTMASLHPARTLGLEKERGCLAPGAQADLVLWDPSFHVMETVIRGRTVWERQKSRRSQDGTNA